ncbi:hypothetical protein EI546_02045 [Aequorivita sp. H23M31]|uniref:Adhesin domain-containing protein n=1 Tax=Aequorivita ciconiae TaxID=2494375 RepID=A0A410FZZ2_9FLAO|nr:hypothetical protein [Aequorivita sp. H23M31]QAA80584.1 hypothetical protein EI546_02045 [Aequorivita sp. H23M31]
MKPIFKLLLMLLLPALAFAGPEKFTGKYTKEKTIKKEYTVNADAELKIENSYGNIDIVSWNENRISIEISIKTNGDNENDTEKRLNEISVDFSGNSSLVTAKTIISSNKGWNFFGSKSNNVSMEINYIIKMPITNSVNLNNSYGAITINELKGNAKIKCEYGQLIIGDLRGGNNSLSFDYTNKSSIGYIKTGVIKANYSGFILRKADDIKLNGNYNNIEILDVKKLSYNCDYGKITIDKIQDLIGKGNYLTSKIGAVTGSAIMNSNYGNISIEKLSSSMKSLSVTSGYTQLKIGFERNLDFNFSINTSYANFKGENLVNVTNSSKDGTNKMYSGYHGSPSSSNVININSNYGNVTFNEI